jgi:hypothetical protein
MGGPGASRTALLPVASVRGVSGERAAAAPPTLRLPTTLVHVVLCTDVCHVGNSKWKVKKVVFTYAYIKNNVTALKFNINSVLSGKYFVNKTLALFDLKKSTNVGLVIIKILKYLLGEAKECCA